MRDRLARIAAATLIAGVVLFAALFAHRVNPTGRQTVADVPRVTPATDLDARLVERGRETYEGLACSRCHRIEGRGNPRSPLDGVGSRLSRAEIRAWATGADPARASLPRSSVRAKQSQASELPASDLEALVEYLASLR